MQYALYFILLTVFFASCKNKNIPEQETVEEEAVQTPVTITSISNEPLNNYIELNATSTYLQSNYIKSSVNGYIRSVHVQPGQFVKAGQLTFVLQTKEARALGNTINNLDTAFRFSGIVSILAPAAGFIADLSHQQGDYVPDGEQLAVLTNSKSFVFILNLPYELRTIIATNKLVEVQLPDGVKLKGVVTTMMPTVDSVSQTQAVLIKVNSTVAIPQNLIAKVILQKGGKINAPSLPKAAILADEAQTNFWVMKLIDSVTAVKVVVIKGLETKDRIEIVRPVFNSADKIVLTGNYGLADTARVKVTKE